MLWAVDHGFEYIEIFEGDLIESESPVLSILRPCTDSFFPHLISLAHNERDKTGLPRLIEALQSVMWSNAQKRTIPKVKSLVPGDLSSLPPPPPKTLGGGAPENVTSVPLKVIPSAN